MNRIDRVTAILVQLQSKKVVKAQEIADRFNISLRTVYRDVKTLEEAGVPILGEAGVGYSIMDGYRLPPVMFTREEATAFITAEKLVEKFTDASTGSNFKSAMYKVRAVLRSAEKTLLEDIEDHIHVMRRAAPISELTISNTLPTILKSISEKKVLHIQYTAFHSDEITERDIEPVGIFYGNGYWHSIAYCRLRKDYRDFRTDRISQMRIADEVFHGDHPSLKSYFEQVSKKENLRKVVISIHNNVSKYLSEAKYYYGFVSEKQVKDRVHMTFLTPSLESFMRWYIMMADQADIIEPQALQELVKRHVEKINRKI